LTLGLKRLKNARAPFRLMFALVKYLSNTSSPGAHSIARRY
jgi:hypothetical protein